MFSRNRFLGVLSALGGTVAALTLLISLNTQAQADVLYVATNGTSQPDDDAHRDASRTIVSDYNHPTNSINNAVKLANYGDVVQVAPGDYAPFYVLKKTNVFIQGQPGAARPVIRAQSSDDNYALINIAGSQYVAVTGFEVTGKDTNNAVVSGPDCNGIVVSSWLDGDEEVIGNHVYVDNCKVHDVGGGGIITNTPTNRDDMGVDYVEMTNNEVYATNSTGQYAGSAISILLARNRDGTTGFHNRIEKNRIYSNIINSDVATQTDCNGIIIDSDDFYDSTAYPSPNTIIQNNLIYNNSGRGIHVFNSSNVVVLNNTLYKNNLNSVMIKKGELSVGGVNVSNVHNVKFSNNVVQTNDVSDAMTDAPAFHAYDSIGLNVTFKNNTWKSTCLPVSPNVDAYDYTTTSNCIDWGTTIKSEVAWGELFYNPAPTDWGSADFRLTTLANHNGLDSQQSQTALNRGSKTTSDYAFWSFNGVDRNSVNVPGGYIDRGAYEQ